jgi:cell division protein FtsA
VTALTGDERESSRTVSRVPRLEEILEILRDRLAASPFAAELRGRVMLTGRACLLAGLATTAGTFTTPLCLQLYLRLHIIKRKD